MTITMTIMSTVSTATTRLTSIRMGIIITMTMT
jgi:hypothetical protein